ncbi:nitric oxide-associated protein 1 [Microplitis demolitor]|uniref:nitric oxide-associated protein 1 n=1 Tax=Microplitis demolitor TaxID=69319 RepID=UPI0004CD1936|nr:nitric oxide-associated protein 1 [Microplitis demolitor]
MYFGKSFGGITRLASNCPCNKMNTLKKLRLCMINMTIRRHINAKVMENLTLDEGGKVKVKIDPKVEELKDKLIYCDYIERRKLKFGYGKNKEIEGKFKKNIEDNKFDELVNKPVYSVALKYLRDDMTSEFEEKKPEENSEEDTNKTWKPIYMPYKPTDEFKPVDLEEAKEEKPMPVLNEQFKKLYESYLEVKKTDSTTRQVKRMENKIFSTDIHRPVDDLSDIPPDWMTDYEQFNDFTEEETWKSNYGKPNPDTPVSSIPCGGCGALLHCQDSAIPGYLPSELFVGLKDEDLKSTVCQRCHFMKYYNATLEVKVSAEEYPKILRNIKLDDKKAAVVLMIDLMDFPCSIWPDLKSVLGQRTPIFVVGNKVDLLPQDCPKFLQNVEDSLVAALSKTGLNQKNIRHVALISAKTGYGIERLITKLQNVWAYKGDVYLIGCTNVGKSTLFNAFLQSDYCKVQAVDLIQRATVSPWPGTTLNLLKFPILNPVKWRLYERMKRRKIQQMEDHIESHHRKQEVTALRDITYATLQERIGRTFTRLTTTVGSAMNRYEAAKASGKFGIDENDDFYKHGRWCYDTPGVVHPDQVINLLTTDELLLTLPRQIISPRSFIFKPGQTLLLAGLGRLDLVTGPAFIRVTVFASKELPITICHTADAIEVYGKLLETEALVVPTNNPERLKIWPQFKSKDFIIAGKNKEESAADILLSSAGWIAITPNEGEEVTMKAWTPEGRGIHLRTPALLAHSIKLRGPRIKSSAAYRCGRQVYIKV